MFRFLIWSLLTIRKRDNAELGAMHDDLVLLLKKQDSENAFLRAKLVQKHAEKDTYLKYQNGEQ